MTVDLYLIREKFPDLLSSALNRKGGITAYQLQLPTFEEGRGFKWAELRLPAEFPECAKAFIQLSPDAVLRLPHLDSVGVLCMEGDPGPGSGYSTEERVIFLLNAFLENFLKPWLKGSLDGAFEAETINYWAIEVARARSQNDPVRAVWTVDQPPKKAMIRSGLLLTPNRIIVAADEALRITNRLVQSVGTAQRTAVMIADVPISYVLTPSIWPKSMGDMERILKGRLSPSDYSKFQANRSRRGREIHRVVLLRNAEIAFAYLLPGGPPTIRDIGKGKWKRKKSFPSQSKMLPLSTSRLDPNWTAGRDQHPEVDQRQAKHVLVLGAGALGGSIVDHLAKAGVGRISLVDADTMSPANVGRHLLGAESIGESKAWAVAKRVNLAFPSTEVTPYSKNTAAWLKENCLAEVHAVLDLTGEPDVRVQIENARQKHPCPLLIGWMEPYVAAAHACFLPSGQSWLQGAIDPLYSLQAVVWPDEVIQQEPGCSSRFQSYTAAAAEHAVALVAECALEMIDAAVEPIIPRVRSWVRGQLYLDKHWPGLKHNEWASIASEFEGLILTRPFP